LVEDLAAGLEFTRPLDRAASALANSMAWPLDGMARFDALAGGQGWGVGGLGREGSAPITITVEAGAIVLTLGEGVDPDAARSAFDSAGDEIASALLTALQRR
jgi:hypothetical protein